MASYTLTIYDVPQENKNIELSYNSNDGHSTKSITIGDTTWTFTLQNLSYSKAIYKPGELIFKLQISECSGVNTIYSTFKGKKVELTAKADNKSSSIAIGYYIFGVQIEKKGNVYYATFQAYDPFKFLTLDKYCKAYTGKKFIQDIFLNKELWPNNITDKNLKSISIEDIEATQIKIKKLNEQIEKETDTEKKKELEKQRNEEEENLIVKKGQFIIIPKAKYLTYKMESETKEFIQPYLVQYNESFFDFLVRVSNRCGEFLYYEDGYFNIGWNKKTKKDKNDKEQDDITPITEYVSVNFSDEAVTGWKENYLVSSYHNYSLTENKIERFPSLLPLDEEKLRTKYGEGYIIQEEEEGKITVTYKINNSGELRTEKNIERSDYEVDVSDLQFQNSRLASDENLVSLPPKDKYTKWKDFALWPGYFFINAVTDIVNSADIIEATGNLISDTGITILNCSLSAKATNDDYEDINFKKGIYTDDRKNGDRIHPFSTSESVKNALDSYVTFSLEFYEAIRKGIEANERSRIQIALGDHFYPLTLGCLIELDGKKYIVVQMNGCANSGAETLDIEAIPYEDKFVFPPAAPVSPIREAKAQRAFITHNADPLKMNRVRVRYPWQGKTESVEDLKASEDSTPWIRIALPMASDGSGFNFLPQIGDEAIINYENGNIEKPYVEGMLYTRAAEEDESTVPYAHKKDKARVISSVNGHSIIFSDPSASSDALNSLSPLMSTIKSFCPTGFIRTELTLQDKDKKLGKLPDSFKKAMGGIEFTDEHGLYSISMSSDKRAISIDSPLGKVDINAFTGITISAPNGNVRIEGKNIDIVAGNNLSISSGNNIVSHFWPTSVQLLKESLKDTVVNVLKKMQPIDMGLIRTFMETLLRPIGGTMLIKSNRYLCIEAGKGEAKIPGRNLKLSNREAIWTGGVKHKETASFFGDIVSAHQYIIDLFNTCKANTIAIGTMIDKYNQRCRPYAILQQPGGLSRDPDDSDILLGNFVANQEYQPLKVQNRGTKDFLNLFSIAMHINDMAKGLYKLVRKSVWNNVKESLSKSLSDPCKTALIALDGNIRTLCTNVYFLDAQHNNRYNSTFNADATINKNELRSVIQQFINNLNGQNPYGITVNLPAQIAGYDDANWNAAIQGITITDSQQQVELDVPSTTGLKRTVVKAWGLNGLFDQYNWDHASGGDILFSRKEGQTLFLDNNTINEYTLANKRLQIKDFLRNI